jgi:hypothetical protein
MIHVGMFALSSLLLGLMRLLSRRGACAVFLFAPEASCGASSARLAGCMVLVVRFSSATGPDPDVSVGPCRPSLAFRWQAVHCMDKIHDEFFSD